MSPPLFHDCSLSRSSEGGTLEVYLDDLDTPQVVGMPRLGEWLSLLMSPRSQSIAVGSYCRPSQIYRSIVRHLRTNEDLLTACNAAVLWLPGPA